MPTTKRLIIEVDEERCDGCGNCMPACPEGALALVDGKARLVRESFCDGLGACLGDCPQGALRVRELEVEGYDEAGVLSHLERTSPALMEKHLSHLRTHAPELLLVQDPALPLAGLKEILSREGCGLFLLAKGDDVARKLQEQVR